VAHGEVSFDADVWIPPVERVHRRAHVLALSLQAFARGFLQPVTIVGAAEVGDEDDLLQLVETHEEIELFAGRLEKCLVLVRRGEPGGTARNGPAVVARDLQVLVAELVESLAPPPVAAIQRQRPNSLMMPRLHAGEDAQRQIGRKLDRVPVEFVPRSRRCGVHGGLSFFLDE